MAVAQIKVGQLEQADVSLQGVAETMSRIEGIDDRLLALSNVSLR